MYKNTKNSTLFVHLFVQNNFTNFCKTQTMINKQQQWRSFLEAMAMVVSIDSIVLVLITMVAVRPCSSFKLKKSGDQKLWSSN